jgi:hypothetical protein
MRRLPTIIAVISIGVLPYCIPSFARMGGRDYGVIKNQDSPHAKLKSVDFRDVRWTGGFWAKTKECGL